MHKREGLGLVWGLVVGGVLLALATLIDVPAFRWTLVKDHQRLDGSNSYHLLIACGDVRAWLVVGAAFLLQDRGRGWGSALVKRGLPLVLSAMIAGATAEVLKRVVGRARPIDHDGAYAFRPFLHDFWDGSDLGMPSSHVAVAFGGACALARLHPRVAPVAWGVAIVCGYARLMNGSHFLSDVVVGALIGWGAARVLPIHRMEGRR